MCRPPRPDRSVPPPGTVRACTPPPSSTGSWSGPSTPIPCRAPARCSSPSACRRHQRRRPPPGQGLLPRAARVAGRHPRPRGRRRGGGPRPGATRFAVGDRVMAVVGGGGQARAARGPRAAPRCPCPTGSPGTWPAASPRRSPRPTTPSSPRPACTVGERVLRPRCRRRRGHGRGAAGRRGRRQRGGDGAQPRPAHGHVAALGPGQVDVVDPEGFECPRSLRRRARAHRRLQPRRRHPVAGHGRAHLGDRASAAAAPRPRSTCSASWGHAAASSPRRSVPVPSRARRPRPAAWSPRCCRCWPTAGSTSPSPPPSRWPRRRPPTSGSPPAPSSARSCSPA